MYAVISLKFKQRSFHKEICTKGADGMANSVDPDQTASLLSVQKFRIITIICENLLLYIYVNCLVSKGPNQLCI